MSEEALGLGAAKRRTQRRGRPRPTTTCANVFDLARQYAAEGRQYGLVICDPPAFARAARCSKARSAGIRSSICSGMKLVRPGGFLVSCSAASS
ncbi:MAG: hypothetical protein V8S99_01265 [Oscillospiraceae bacterium]